MEALILASQRVVAFCHFNSNPSPLTSICARCDLLWGGRSARQWILKIHRCPSRLPGTQWSHWHLFFLRTTLISWAHRVNYWAWDIQQGWDITTSWTLFLADCGVSTKVQSTVGIIKCSLVHKWLCMGFFFLLLGNYFFFTDENTNKQWLLQSTVIIRC